MAVAALLVASCSSHDDDSVPMQTVTMPIKLAIPAEGFGDPTDIVIGGDPSEATRLNEKFATRNTKAGDPGNAETFQIPQYLHIFVASEYDDPTTNTTECQVIYKKLKVEPKDWTFISGSQVDNNYANNSGNQYATTDGIYRYDGELSIDLPLQRTRGKLYVAASPVDLEIASSTSNQNMYYGSKNNGKYFIDGVAPTALQNVSADDLVENVLYLNQNDVRTNLQDIYSSPYNLTRTDGSYYGTINDYTSKIPNIYMMLYHVATKVDVQWTVDEAVQGNVSLPKNSVNKEDMSIADASGKVFLSLIEMRNLPKDNCLLFKPMEVTTTSGYDVQLMGTETAVKDAKGNATKHTNDGKKYNDYYYENTDVSTRWYGRSVGYIIPTMYSSALYYDSNGNSSTSSSSTKRQGDGSYSIHLKLLVNNYTTASSTNSDDAGYVFYPADHATRGHNTYIKIDKSKLKLDKPDNTGNPVFTPWLRVNIVVDASNVDKVVKFSQPTNYLFAKGIKDRGS